jgi:hypothetical protein
VNLGVVTLARRLNPDIFVVVRQNDAADRVLIDAARANLRFVQSDLIVRECLQILKTPMLGDFINRIRAGGSTQASKTIELIMATVGNASPRKLGVSAATPCSPECSGLSFRPTRIRHAFGNLPRTPPTGSGHLPPPPCPDSQRGRT